MAKAPASLPPELAGTWHRLEELDGRWVVHMPCGDAPYKLSVQDGKALIHLDLIFTEVADDEIVSLEVLPDGYDLLVQPGISPDEPPRVWSLRWTGPEKKRLREEGGGIFVRDEEFANLEEVLELETECAPVDMAPISSWPAKWTLVGHQRQGGSWVATDQRLEIDRVSQAPTLTWSRGGEKRTGTLQGAYGEGRGLLLGVLSAEKLLGYTFFRAEQVRAPNDPALPGPAGKAGVSEAPLPRGELPKGAWFVQLPGEPAWRTIAWLPEGEPVVPEGPGAGPGPGKAKSKGKSKGKQKAP